MIPALGLRGYLAIAASICLVSFGIYLYVLVTNLRASNATLTAQIASQNAAIAQQAAAANAKALADQTRMDQEKASAAADFQAKLDAANETIARVEAEAANAKPEDVVCPTTGGLPLALVRAVDELHSASTSSNSGNGGAKGQGRSSASGLQAMALRARTAIDIGPAKADASAR